MMAVEANADGLIGPTHSYAGLSPGNLASSLNKGEASNPRADASGQSRPGPKRDFGRRSAGIRSGFDDRLPWAPTSSTFSVFEPGSLSRSMAGFIREPMWRSGMSSVTVG